ncbi:MAG: bifunctional metallophosphatase/5'-nucleotidase [Ignavibacteriaceae bacterium]|nr:bifunctional metallophosphatase/5'-nucleotidase [Ignavibacteriaceae bacterium]
MLKKLFIAFCISLLCLASLSAQTINLKIIETSDVHGAIFPYDLRNNRSTNSSLAQVTTYLKQERAEENQHVILLDNGDILQGDPVVYYYNFEKTDTIHIYADVMNYMQYDAATIGNHDIEPGHDVYDKFKLELDFPWMAANAVDNNTSDPYFKPYTLIEKDGIKIAVLGIITPAIPQWLPEQIWKGMHFEDMIESAQKWIKIIKQNEQPDLMIGLFHAGVDFTYNDQNENTYKNENASRLVAEKVPGFDIVFVGHDHTGWNFTTTNTNNDTVLILGTLAGARTITVANVEMEFDKTCRQWNKEKINGEVIQIKDFEPDKDFMNKFSLSFEEVKEYVERPIGYFEKTISSKESLFGPSEFVDLIHTIQLEISGADISFTAPLLFNAEIKEGNVFVRDMFNLYRYENLLYTMELSGKEIKDFLEYSYEGWFNQMKDENDHLLNFAKDDKGNIRYSERNQAPELKERFYNYESAAGINYTVDVSKRKGQRVSIKSLSDGSEFDLNKLYTVAINSYRGNGGGGHLTRGVGIKPEDIPQQIIQSTEKDLRYYLMKWIEKKHSIYPQLIGNWIVIPENWWEKGKAKDYKILFKN